MTNLIGKITKLAMIPILAYTLSSCDKSEQMKVNGSSYEVNSEQIIQKKSSFLEDGEIKIGLVSDIEGSFQNAQISASELKKENVDAIIISGDCYENESIRRNPVNPNSTNNLEEMISGIKPYADIGAPVFLVAGNHESKEIYERAIDKLKESYSNVFDINDKSVDLKEFNIVGMGGYHDLRFTDPEGFLLGEDNYERALNSLKDFKDQNEYTIFVTHGPPKSDKRIDYVEGVGNVGDPKITKIMNDKSLDKVVNVHGHIHEGGRNAVKYNSGMAINVASITDYMNRKGLNTPMIVIKNDKIDYKELFKK